MTDDTGSRLKAALCDIAGLERSIPSSKSKHFHKLPNRNDRYKEGQALDRQGSLLL
jgi:hypothetical protein